MKETELIFNWAKFDQAKPLPKTDSPNPHVDIDDESLRDGLQGTQAMRPSIEEQKFFLELLEDLGIEHADIGFPASDERQKEAVATLVKHRIQKGLQLSLSCAARALEEDIKSLIEISVATGDFPLEADIFLGSSRLRALINQWDRTELVRLTKRSVSLAKKHGLPVMFVTEDSTRAYPEDLLELYRVAIECGADRICIADTVGVANEKVTRNIVRFVRGRILKDNPNVKIDWHGHNDRGLALANCIVAAEKGVNRLHATTLCIGERSGNVDLAQLLLNLNLEGFRSDDLTKLQKFAEYSAKILNMTIPVNAPIIGETAHSTSSGVHADAILKALAQGDHDLASKVYFAYDPESVGRRIEIKAGPMSGKSNIRFVLERLGIEPTEERVEVVLRAAKSGSRVLSDEEVVAISRRISG